MKTKILKTVFVMCIGMLCISCSNDDEVTPEITTITSFEKAGRWSCELGQTCEDTYQFTFEKNSKIAISIEEVNAESAVSLDLSADFGQFGGPNLLNEGKLSYYGCSEQGEGVVISNIIIMEKGVYNLSIARDWGLSAGNEGTYRMSIISDTPFAEESTTIDDVQVLNYERECL